MFAVKFYLTPSNQMLDIKLPLKVFQVIMVGGENVASLMQEINARKLMHLCKKIIFNAVFPQAIIASYYCGF